MLIHRTTDYAIRLLCCVAGAKNPVSSSRLAAELGVSPRYVLHFGAVLREAGFVQVTGGPAGGFFLARSPENISLWDVFTCMENGEGLVPTASEGTALGEFYTMVEEEFRAELQGMTLEKLCRQKREP